MGGSNGCANDGIVIKEVEEEELLFQTTEEKKKIKEARLEGQKKEATEKEGGVVPQGAHEEAKVKVEERGGAKFY